MEPWAETWAGFCAEGELGEEGLVPWFEGELGREGLMGEMGLTFGKSLLLLLPLAALAGVVGAGRPWFAMMLIKLLPTFGELGVVLLGWP